VAFTSTAFRELGAADALEQIEARLGFPLVVKPAAQGSALGVRFAGSREDVPEALVSALSYDDRVLLERHVSGRELAVSLLDGDPLPVVEARAKEEDRFNYEARYEIGRTEYVCPADLPDEVTAAVQDIAARAYDTLGCSGFARVDLVLDGDERPDVLEANAIPGLTDTSLLPMAAHAAGLDFENLVARIVELALEQRAVPASPSGA
jgi:D-alanine-D-alanine ligase